MKFSRIPTAAIARLSRYTRALEELDAQNIKVVSSEKLAEYCEVNSAQIRKDLAYFGEFGVRGVGYFVRELLFEIRRILGLNKEWNLAIIGMGNLGCALIAHANFARQGYRFVAAFDVDTEKIGRILPGGIAIAPMSTLKKESLEKEVEVAVIATPASKAQDVVNQVVEVPIYGILNFSPAQLHLPEGFLVHHIDFTVKLDRLAYRLSHLTRSGRNPGLNDKPWISKHLL
jgi:redox-sensing transcriptional repressor